MGRKVGFLVMDIILLLIFYGLIKTIFKFSGRTFLLEIIVLLVLLFFSIIALIGFYNGMNWGSYLHAFIFLLILADLLLISRYINAGRMFYLSAVFSAIGLVFAVSSIRNENEPYKESEKEEPVYTNFEPGKYVASKTATTYHTANCDWAKKIKEPNRVWFDTEAEAKKQGYNKHSCLE